MVAIVSIIVVLVVLALLSVTIYDFIGVYRNPFPVFHNSDKRLSEIYKDKDVKDKYKTRSIIEDMEHGLQ